MADSATHQDGHDEVILNPSEISTVHHNLKNCSPVVVVVAAAVVVFAVVVEMSGGSFHFLHSDFPP